MDIKLDLVTQDPIDFNNIVIYQPTFGEIKKYGIDKFNQLLLPYSLTFDLLNIPEDKQSKYDLFDDIVMKDEMMFNLLILSLQFFCKTDNISLADDGIKIENGILNKNNFDEFSRIVLEINAREKPKIEKPKFANERQRDIYEKLQAGRKRAEAKEALQLCDILNAVEFGGKYHIPIKLIKTWTLWRIMNAYKTILGKENWDSSFEIYLVNGEKSLIEKHWTQQIRVSQ